MFKHSRIFPIILNIFMFLSSLFGSALTVTPVYAAGITVNTTVDEDNTGANCSLREAITAANINAAYGGCTAGSGADIITLPIGTYTLTLAGAGEDANATGDLDIAGPLTIIGVDPDVENIIIQAGPTPGSGIDRVFHITGAYTVSISNVIIVYGNCASCDGGGIYNSGTLTMTGILLGNSAANGGGIYNSGTLTMMTNSFFESSFFENSATANGGGIYSSGTLTMTGVEISDGSATVNGGGIYNSGNLTMMNNSIFDNSATANGGGIYNSGTLTMTSGFVSENSATNGGGIDNDATAAVTNSTFSDNSATANGGGIYSTNTLTITNSTFSVNAAASGGGIYNDGGSLAVNNSILANTVASATDCHHTVGTLSGANNIIETTSTCSSAATITSDPNLGTLTGSPAYFPLNTGSPAIDAGSDAVCVAAPVNNTSQNGVTRPQGAHCDIGSFEYPVSASIDVIIGGTTQGSYVLPLGSSQRVNYAGLDNGPVKVVSTNTVPIIAALRDAWAVNGVTTSFSQLMGLPLSQVSDKYVFPAYNNVTLNEQLRIGNVNDTNVPSTVTVTIGGVLQGTYTLQQNEAIRINYAGLDSGPVVVDGTDGVDIIAAIREAWAVNGVTKSFVQLMGLPASQLSNKYVFPAYNNVTLNEQLRIGNVNDTNVPSTVNVTIGGVLQGTYTLQQNEAIRINYAGLDSGPVVVEGTLGVNIIAAIRDAWAVNGVTTSFSQLMGMPAGGLSDQYIFPAYNNVTLNEQLRIGNVDSVPTTVTVTIGGVLQGSYDLDPDEAVRINYAGLDSGPVIIDGTNGVDIIAAIRDAWAVNGVTQSFVQLMGLPFEQLSTTYLFPAYNNVTLNEQLRFGVP